MDQRNALSLAKQIIELDLLRDEILENLLQLVGEQAHDLLRKVQNGH